MATDSTAKTNLIAQGWALRPPVGFNGTVGELWTRREGDALAIGFVAGPEHLNRAGAVHGGMLATMADNLLGWNVMERCAPRLAATIELHLHYVSAGRSGDFIEGHAEIVEATRSLIFVRGRLSVGTRLLVAVDGIWKIFAEKPAPALKP